MCLYGERRLPRRIANSLVSRRWRFQWDLVANQICLELSVDVYWTCTGEPNGAWALDLPAEEVPAELPEPCLGINFARDGMSRKEWLALVAVHSDAWLMSVAFYYGAKLNSEQRCVFQIEAQSRICKMCYSFDTESVQGF